MNVKQARIEADLAAINSHNETPGQGITRPTFSPAYLGAVGYVAQELAKIGARVRYVRGGSLLGRLAGSEAAGPAVMIGSHLDSVAHGGEYDGTAGVVCALETARVLVESGFANRLPVEVVVFAEEEGSRFRSGLLGSSILTGRIELDELDRFTDEAGLGYGRALAETGLVIEDEGSLGPDDVAAMVEIHIEQSTVLDNRGLDVGLVEAIVGLSQLTVTLTGQADHAGATPMNVRFDALQGAAEIINKIDRLAADHSNRTVATVGQLRVSPGQTNVIPGEVVFSLDVRDADSESLWVIKDKFRELVARVGRARGLTQEVREDHHIEPVILSERVLGIMESRAADLGLSSLRMVSGAGHDTANLAPLGRAGMIFLPSREGRSHCPEEYTAPAQVAAGARLMLATVRDLAG